MNNQPTSECTTSRWERRKERTQRRLLEAAERLFRTQGFDATTVEEIAEAADVAKGTFFNYFESKESVLGVILYTRIQPLLATPPGAGQPADERILQLIVALWEELYPYRHIARRIFFQAMATPSEGSPAAVRPITTLAALIAEGQAQGLFRPEVDAELAAMYVSAFFFKLFVLECIHRDSPPDDWRALLERALDLLYHGLKAESGISSDRSCT